MWIYEFFKELSKFIHLWIYDLIAKEEFSKFLEWDCDLLFEISEFYLDK